VPALSETLPACGAVDRRGGLVAHCPAVGLAIGGHGFGPFANALDVRLSLKLPFIKRQLIYFEYQNHSFK
jgi:hypothetical protein